MTLLVGEHDVLRGPPLRKTRAEELRAQLADDIVRGTLAPGQTLDEMELARRFGVSRTPVRGQVMNASSACSKQWRSWKHCVLAWPPNE